MTPISYLQTLISLTIINYLVFLLFGEHVLVFTALSSSVVMLVVTNFRCSDAGIRDALFYIYIAAVIVCYLTILMSGSLPFYVILPAVLLSGSAMSCITLWLVLAPTKK